MRNRTDDERSKMMARMLGLYGIAVEPTAQCVQSGRRFISPDAHLNGYVGSTRNGISHQSGSYCAGLVSRENMVRFSSRQEAITTGYYPCFNCKP